jgi:hypothetical protein
MAAEERHVGMDLKSTALKSETEKAMLLLLCVPEKQRLHNTRACKQANSQAASRGRRPNIGFRFSVFDMHARVYQCSDACINNVHGVGTSLGEMDWHAVASSINSQTPRQNH